MAALNREYQELIGKETRGWQGVDDQDDNRLIVHEFFRGNKQALLADLVVGTIDQILLASLKQKHFMLRHLGLCGKAIIVDECHAFDAYMNEYLDRTLRWLGEYRTPVILLSATLPYERRADLVKAYLGEERKCHEDEQWQKSLGYPLLTWTDGNQVCQKNLEYTGDSRHIIINKAIQTNVPDEQIDATIQVLDDQLSQGGCAGIFVNTVSKAQRFADILKQKCPDKEVLLLHSRFLATERTKKEMKLLKLLGKKSTKADRDGVILVGTQVIEQSLDFDVDIMVTELCPMDLLLQRIGRLHRHAHHDQERPINLKQATCYVLGTNGELDKGGSAVPDPRIFPAHAGVIPPYIQGRLNCAHIPRTSEGDPRYGFFLNFMYEYSPRMRG
ncbi:MAG: CRISPR-associated helicase Cas3' [Lachnospiraceae bacterium]|nr:CRISPR-associated helicase Cas3' [Lachnospiraceae bacterium]